MGLFIGGWGQKLKKMGFFGFFRAQIIKTATYEFK
jgi:hypothetical protein